MIVGGSFDKLALVSHKLVADLSQLTRSIPEAVINLPWKLVDELLRSDNLGGEVYDLLRSRLKDLLVILDQGIIRVPESIEVPAESSNSDDVHGNFGRPVIDL